MSLIKVACVGYTNAWPLTRHLDPQRFDVVPCVPSEAARLLRTGEADVGLIPVAALLSDGDWRVVPGLSIGCDGPVASVLLVGETPLEEWDAVALDGESRTSVVLAQILLRGPLGRPDVRVYPVDAGTGAFHAQGRTGAVVIGDAARNLPDRLTTRVDLGEVWKRWTGLPFVFAVWAGRPDLPPEALAGLRAAAERGLAERAFAPEHDRYYLTENIRYGLDDRAIMGLRRFAALGKAQGLLKRDDVSLFGPPRRFQPVVSVDGLLSRAAAGERMSADDLERIERDAKLTDLGAAAHLRRLALHPAGIVTWSASPSIDVGAERERLRARLLSGEGVSVPEGLGVDDVAWLVRALDRPAESVVETLVEAGLEQLAAGGDRATMRAAAARGVRLEAWMDFGGGESAAQRVAGLVALRALQDDLRGFGSFHARAAIPDGRGWGNATAAAWLRLGALARLALDNVPSVRASPDGAGPGVAQAALYMGCDDFGQVRLDTDGGALSVEEVEHHIRIAGFTPVRRGRRPAAAEVRDAPAQPSV